jgi:hypothetical protein
MKNAFTSLILCLLFVSGAALLADPSCLSALDLPPALLPTTLALLTTGILFACHWAINRLLARLPQ